MSDSLQPHGLYSPWNSLGQNTVVGSLSLLQGIFPTQVFRIAGDSSPAKPQGKPKNTGVGSLSLLQLIFPPQELNLDLLHCRQILYQLNYTYFIGFLAELHEIAYVQVLGTKQTLQKYSFPTFRIKERKKERKEVKSLNVSNSLRPCGL